MWNGLLRIRLIVILLAAGLLSGCSKPFKYSPFDGSLPKQYNSLRTETQLNRILNEFPNDQDTIRVAFLSDTHYHTKELRAAVNHINTRSDIDFTVLCGDLSDQGLQKEYMMLYDELKRLHKPVLTIIGNHDYLAQAEGIYSQMFGPLNYSLELGGYHFVFFDNIFWEKGGDPDFDWLESQQIADGFTPILISHIPPTGDQYDDASRQRHLSITRSWGLPLSIHGHLHHYAYSGPDDAGTRYLQIPDPSKRQLVTVSFRTGGRGIDVQTENF